MARMFVLLSLVALHLGAASSPCATGAPPPPPATTTGPCDISTTGWCDTPLCKGLVGAGAGVAGLAAIGGITGALLAKKATTTAKPTKAAAAAVTQKPMAAAISTSPVIKAREDAEEGSGWLLPLLLGLLLLCCLLGVIGYFCMNKSKRATKVKKTKKAPTTESKEVVVAPEPEAAPLMGGHWEQPMQMVPVTTTSSYVPAPVTTASYIAAPATYATAPTVVETVAPTYAGYAPTYATAPTALVGTGAYTSGFATTAAPIVGTAGYGVAEPGFVV